MLSIKSYFLPIKSDSDKKRRRKKRLKWNTIEREFKSFEIEIEIVVFSFAEQRSRNVKFVRKIRQDVNQQGKHPRNDEC